MADVLATDCCRDSSGLALPNVSQSLKFSRRFHGERGGGVDVHIFVLKNTPRRNGHSARTDLYDTREFTSIVFFVARQHNNADARY